MKNLKRIGLIMAGGNGTRFWPSSRQTFPKQFLKLTHGDTLLNETLYRVNKIIDWDDLYIVANINHKDLLNETLPSDFKLENIIYEPLSRNTAPCIIYSAFHLRKIYENAIMCVFPADHHIMDSQSFSQTLIKGICQAEQSNHFVTLGIKPSFPATGYGYMNADISENKPIYSVNQFVEKPDSETAKIYFNSPNYFWNSGIFIWSIDTILKAAERETPLIYSATNKLFNSFPFDYDSLEETYSNFQKISIDYAILEKDFPIDMVPLEASWSDVGSWDAIYDLNSRDSLGNVSDKNTISIDSKNNLIMSSKKVVAAIDVNDVILVETDDAILLCSNKSAQRVKEIVDILKKDGKEHLV